VALPDSGSRVGALTDGGCRACPSSGSGSRVVASPSGGSRACSASDGGSRVVASPTADRGQARPDPGTTSVVAGLERLLQIQLRGHQPPQWRVRWPPSDPAASGVDPLPLSLPLCRQPVGLGLARPLKLVVLRGSARHENRSIVLCLGRRPGPWPCEARLGRHGVPCRPVGYRAVLARARARPGRSGPLAIYSLAIGCLQATKQLKVSF